MSWSPDPLPPDWPSTRQRILTRDNHRCYINGCPLRASEVDHIVPRSQGGTNHDSNLAAICTHHHRTKTAREANKARRIKYSRLRQPDPHPGRLAPN